MPYIKETERKFYDSDISDLASPISAGELNYLLTRIVLDYLRHHGEKYQTYVEIEGVLSHMSKEIYRRLTGPYEDRKIAENGDVEGF